MVRRGSVLSTFGMLALFLLQTAVPAAATPTKIGFVNLDQALRELPEARAGAVSLNRLIAQKQKQIDASRQRIVSYQKDLEKSLPVLDNVQRQAREAQLQSMVMHLQKAQQQAQDEINVERNHILENIQDQLVQVVSRIGRDGKYTLILNDKSVLYVSGATDLTQQVVSAMERHQARAAGGR